MLDDEVTIMNEISRPPPPPPPDRRHESHWERQHRASSENGRGMRRKDGGRGFTDRKRENMKQAEQMERQMGYQGSGGNQMHASMHMVGNSSHGGDNMGNMENNTGGGNINMVSGNINTGGGVPFTNSLGGVIGVGTVPMQISPTSQHSHWVPSSNMAAMPNMSQPPTSMSQPPMQNMSQPPMQNMSQPPMQNMPPPTMQNMAPPPMQNMAPPPMQNMAPPPMQNMPPPMLPTQALPSRGSDGQVVGPMMQSMEHMGPMIEPGQGPCPMMDPATGQMMPPWSLPSMVGSDGQLVKQPITYRLSVLYPPNPQAPPPTTRERPPGCRTVFIGGLPENAVEEHVVDVFAKCGEIQTVRMSKKNFCHIRYCAEYCVDNAIYLSGWRMRIDNCSDGPNTGRLHVDFAQARDDLYEWECKQRAAEREARHRNRIIQDMNRTPSPPPVVHFSDHEAQTVTEEIRGENMDRSENWGQAMDTLMTWLERGDCSKRNAHTFYTMIQVASSHVKRLLGEQTEYEQELVKMKEDFRAKMSSITVQFTQIERVFGSASKQKVWDHFTKAQRKNLTQWKKQLQDVRNLTKEHSMSEEDMDLEEEQEKDDPVKKKIKLNPDKLREESEEWACQAQTYRNEVESVKADMKSELETKEQQIKILQQTLQGMQLQLLEAQKKSGNLPGFLLDSQEKKVRVQDASSTKDNLAVGKPEEVAKEQVLNTSENDDPTTIDIVAGKEKDEEPPIVKVALAGEDARLVAVISTFLNVHPFGAGADYIWSYLLRVDPSITYKEVEELLEKYSTCFTMEVEGIGATMSRIWKLIAFKPEK